MRCHEFDANIEGILSGAALPEADEHMRECERCTSRFRARTAVKSGLRHLAGAPLAGPARATDRAVMASYRKLRLRPATEPALRPAAQGARLLGFPRRTSVARMPIFAMRPQVWMGGAAAAAVAVAVLGVGLYRSNQISPAGNVATAGNVPAIAAAPSAVTSDSLAESSAAQGAAVQAVASSRDAALAAKVSRQRMVSARVRTVPAPAAAQVVLAKRTVEHPASALSGSARTEVASAAVAAEPQASPTASSVMHLASTGDSGAAAATVGVERAPSAGATWPGYSNLMYCDPVVCSGPMPVVRIRVPAGQGEPSTAPGAGDGYVNADVIIGPDGVARAIRVAN